MYRFFCSGVFCGHNLLQVIIVSFGSSRQNSAGLLGDDRIEQCYLSPHAIELDAATSESLQKVDESIEKVDESIESHALGGLLWTLLSMGYYCALL
jgi:hypothetical protein